ncbi:NFATC2-interacting protein [Tachysurus vachellii]|uniref:NFATC2-interacting protein n=1 Tax=Tachysurus vachellii TaxID=175792 RepID=UPI00296B4013|nr:NFATC2-interacting protein [Tachysurus vachellii]
MAEAGCDSDVEIIALNRTNPPSKRRRILEPSAITPAPLYSNKVTRSRQKKPTLFTQKKCTDVSEEVRQWPSSLSRSKNKPFSINLSDSDEEPRPDKPQSLNQKLDAPSSLLCGKDDIIISSSEDKQKRHPAKPKRRKRAQEISLKFRWQQEMHKISVLSTDPLSKAVAQLSVKLKVPPSKILLLRNDDKLPVHATITQLDLCTADIIDCLLITDNKEDESSCDVITVRLQGKEKGSAKEYSLHKNAPLDSVLSQYTKGLSAVSKHRVTFLFDGLKVKLNQTPSQLDMEDGDVIDVWA